jgi:shikimate kinase
MNQRRVRNAVSTPSYFAGSKTPYPVVALTGFMGSGKSSTGATLAELLGWNFIDLDEEIERQEQVPIRQLFRERGEAAFRSIEHGCLRKCLAENSGPTILALGGGAFIQSNNTEILRARQVQTVFLETPVEDMMARCGVAEDADAENPRPLAADTAAFRDLYEQRLPWYRTADLTINTSGKTLEMIARAIAKSLNLVPSQ